MAQRKFKFGDIVRVDWRDACGWDGWKPLDRLPEDGAMLTSTTGFFIKQSKHGIWLAGLVNEDRLVNGVSFVPSGMVLKTTRVARQKAHYFPLSRRKGTR